MHVFHIVLEQDSEILVYFTSFDTLNFSFESNFKVIGSLGGGGFGHVLHIRHSLDKADYALKVVPLPEEYVHKKTYFYFNLLQIYHCREHRQEKALREIHALARLQNPHIVQYFHSWLDKPPEGWICKEGWKEMKKKFM